MLGIWRLTTEALVCPLGSSACVYQNIMLCEPQPASELRPMPGGHGARTTARNTAGLARTPLGSSANPQLQALCMELDGW